MNYNEALEYIHSINWEFCKPGLERIRTLCEGLSHPERELKFIHVAGTNGKGSFCAMTERILREAGFKTGLFTSPYVKFFGERMRFCGEPVSDAELAEICEYVKPVSDKMAEKPTEFELITAVAFEFFKRKGCDVVILEAGMGGRLDSTNIIENPLLSVITGVALDHVDYLGDTVEKIAAEKAGIIKDGCPVLFGGTDPAALGVILNASERKNSALERVDYSALEIKRMTLEGSVFDFGGHKNLELSLLGKYQPRNAALVVTAAELLRRRGLVISDENIYNGLKKTSWSARFEKLSDDPVIIFDGAHNKEGIDAAVSSIEAYFGEKKICLITGVMKDKDFVQMAHRLAPVSARVFTVKPPNPRALDAESYAEVFRRENIPASSCPDASSALAAARAYAKAKNFPIICLGSLYLYSEISAALSL